VLEKVNVGIEKYISRFLLQLSLFPSSNFTGLTKNWLKIAGDLQPTWLSVNTTQLSAVR